MILDKHSLPALDSFDDPAGVTRQIGLADMLDIFHFYSLRKIRILCILHLFLWFHKDYIWVGVSL